MINTEICAICKIKVPFKYGCLFSSLQTDAMGNAKLVLPDSLLFQKS